MRDPFDVLGLEHRYRIDRAQLEQRHRDLSRALHPDRYVSAAPAERRVALERAVEVNDAFRALRESRTRGEALLRWAGREVAENARAAPALLAEVMELREELEDARRSAPGVTAALVARVDARIAAEETALAEAFADPGARPSGDALDRAEQAVVRLRYFYRFRDEAEALTAEGDAR